MRLLILGGGGMLGHKLAQSLGRDFETWVTLRGSAAAYNRYRLVDPSLVVEGVDVQNLGSVIAALAVVRPEAVINCIGIIKQLPAAKDPILSLTVNSLLPHRLHRLCLACGARLIHFSTDCVFSGRKGKYTEDDPSDALDLYGRSKFLGETRGDGRADDSQLDHRPRAVHRERARRMVPVAAGKPRAGLYGGRSIPVSRRRRWRGSSAGADRAPRALRHAAGFVRRPSTSTIC